MGDYMRLTVSPESLLDTMKNCHCRLLRGQVTNEYPNISTIHVTIYRSPGYTYDVERYNKIGKIFLSQLRYRVNEVSMNRKVAVAHN